MENIYCEITFITCIQGKIHQVFLLRNRETLILKLFFKSHASCKVYGSRTTVF